MIETATSGGLVPFCDPELCVTAGCDAVICRGAALTNSEIVERSRRVIPGGVNSPIRSFRSVGGTPYVVAKGSGARVNDVEGTEYLDLVQSYGAVIHGHAHPRITAAIIAAAADGTSFGAPTPREMKIAEEITSRVPGMQMVRLVNSGTEATMAVIRLARGHTGRDKVLKFSGNYHGHGDALLTESGSAFAVFGLPDSAGVTGKSVSETLVAPYNVVPTLDEQTACIVVEPVAANMGLVAPKPGFLEGLRAECDRVGALLIFDEVITGFRLARGGAAQYYGVTPDLWCFGKVIGGGLPVGAFGGRADVMASLSNDSYEQLYATAERLGAGLQSAFDRAGLPAVVPVVGSLVGLHLAAEPAFDYTSAKTTDVDRYRRFFHAMLQRGVAMAPGAYEVMFPGLAHTDDVIDAIIERAHEAAAEVG
jgi:glutamate-1-semialdehyde 2,1-aminomutase